MTTRMTKGFSSLLLALGLVVLPSAEAFAQVVQYYHLDGLGNVRVVTDQTGAVVERHDYLPFGEECLTGPCASNPGVGAGQPRKFTGKERDAETGLDYFGARYYVPTVGRFTTVDPSMTLFENTLDPQRWNRYGYGRNNPLRFVDPDGRDWLAELFFGARGKDVSTWDALTGSEARGQYAKTAEEHPVITAQLAVTPTLLSGPLGEVVAAVAAPFRLNRARAARDELAAAVKKDTGDAPATATAGYNRETGQVAARCSGGGKCAEDHVVDALGGDPSKVRFTEATRPRTGREVPVCPRCETNYGREAFPTGTRFKSDEPKPQSP